MQKLRQSRIDPMVVVWLSFGAVVLSAVVLWFGSYLMYGFCLAIRTDSGPMRHNEVTNRSLQKKIRI